MRIIVSNTNNNSYNIDGFIIGAGQTTSFGPLIATQEFLNRLRGYSGLQIRVEDENNNEVNLANNLVTDTTRLSIMNPTDHSIIIYGIQINPLETYTVPSYEIFHQAFHTEILEHNELHYYINGLRMRDSVDTVQTLREYRDSRAITHIDVKFTAVEIDTEPPIVKEKFEIGSRKI